MGWQSITSSPLRGSWLEAQALQLPQSTTVWAWLKTSRLRANTFRPGGGGDLQAAGALHIHEEAVPGADMDSKVADLSDGDWIIRFSLCLDRS